MGNDDAETPKALVGKKIAPIWVDEDGAMAESLDIIAKNDPEVSCGWSDIETAYACPVFTKKKEEKGGRACTARRDQGGTRDCTDGRWLCRKAEGWGPAVCVCSNVHTWGRLSRRVGEFPPNLPLSLSNLSPSKAPNPSLLPLLLAFHS